MASSLALKRFISSNLLPKPLAAPSASSRFFSSGDVGGGDDLDSAPVAVLFHASGLTCNQWRKLKNLLNPGKTLFRPSIPDGKNKKKFFKQLKHSAGPTCVVYLPEGALEKLNLLPSGDAVDQDFLLLYGQDKSNLVDHIDVGKVSELDEMETSLFNFYLPSSYLCSVLDPVFASKEGEQTGSEAPEASAEQS